MKLNSLPHEQLTWLSIHTHVLANVQFLEEQKITLNLVKDRKVVSGTSYQTKTMCCLHTVIILYITNSKQADVYCR